MALKIEEGEGRLNNNNLEFFLKGNLALEKDDKIKPHDWIPEQGWQDIKKLVEITNNEDPNSPLANLIQNFTNNEQKWKEFYDLEVRKAHFLKSVVFVFSRHLKRSDFLVKRSRDL